MSALAATAQRGPLDIGEQFLGFEIRGLLGHGGHGWVYHGYAPFLERHVAIKVIPSPADRGRDLERRAQLEARVLCQLQHHNVVHVIDAGATAGGAMYLVMELLYGRTLREAIREHGQLSVAEVLAIGAQIADGVQAAHEQNTLHRDLKPENVFLREENAIKVLDFGIAKFSGAGVAAQRDLLHGTISYMSPEHLQGLRVTVRSDIYALGTTLYEALSGCAPCLVGMGEPTLESVTFAQINRMPLTLDVLTGAVPRFVARTIQRMIAKAPADRFATMAEVAQVLRVNAQRFAKEVPSGTAPTRKLWLGARSISPTSGAVRLSDATDVRERAPITAPLSGTHALAPAIRAEVTTPTPRPNAVMGGARATLTPSAGQAFAFEAESFEPPLSPARTPLTLPQFLLCGVALGTLIGLLVALVQTYPRPVAPSTRASGSAVRPSPGPPRPTPAVTAASAMPTAAEQALAVAPTTSATAAAKPVPHRPQLPPRIVAKPPSAQPSSRLPDTPDLEKAAKPSGAPLPKPNASVTRRPKAIYGSDEGAE